MPELHLRQQGFTTLSIMKLFKNPIKTGDLNYIYQNDSSGWEVYKNFES